MITLSRSSQPALHKLLYKLHKSVTTWSHLATAFNKPVKKFNLTQNQCVKSVYYLDPSFVITFVFLRVCSTSQNYEVTTAFIYLRKMLSTKRNVSLRKQSILHGNERWSRFSTSYRIRCVKWPIWPNSYGWHIRSLHSRMPPRTLALVLAAL